MKTFNLTNSDGYEFQLLILNKGDAYGLGNCLVWDEDKPLVEFYDVKHSQFVSRYYVETLLEHGNYGLCLQGGIPVWSIDAESMELVKAWLKTI